MSKFDILLLIVGFGALVFFSQMPMQGLPTDVQPAVVLNPDQQANGPDQIYGFPVLARFSVTQFKIVDGDSIRLQTSDGGEIDLRLASIDAPELNQTSGKSAKQHLEALTAGRTATFLQTDTDRYQRRVVFMFVTVASGELLQTMEVNAQMVADGFAWHSVKYSNREQLSWLQQQAKQNRLGLWATLNPVPPWDYRDRKP